MIVLDTSAIMALLLSEEKADQIADALSNEDRIMISAGTLAETLIVASHRGLTEEVENLIKAIGVEVEVVGADKARDVWVAYSKWGKGVHPASLNFGDCFAFATAKSNNAPLLFVGDDFSKTDIAKALA